MIKRLVLKKKTGTGRRRCLPGQWPFRPLGAGSEVGQGKTKKGKGKGERKYSDRGKR